MSARVLWLSNETPDKLGQGGQRRQYFQIAALAEAGAEVTVATLQGPQSDVSARGMAVVHRVRPRIRGRLPNPMAKVRSDCLARGQWSAVVIAHTESWRRWSRLAARTGAPVFVDLHNVMGRVDPQLALVEQEIARQANAVGVCSPTEASRLSETIGSIDRVELVLLPHGVDASEWTASPLPGLEPSVRLFGSWGWGPNKRGLEWLLSQVWDEVHSRTGAICEIAGSGVDAGPLPQGVHRVGRVADLAGFLSTAWVLPVPVIQGLGAPVKFLEALATGVPVIATSDGAPIAQDLAGVVADDAERWVDWMCATLTKPDKAREKALASRESVLREFTWSRTSAPLLEWVDRNSSPIGQA